MWTLSCTWDLAPWPRIKSGHPALGAWSLSLELPGKSLIQSKKKKKHTKCVCWLLSRVWLFATPWAVAPRLLCPWDSPGKNTGVGGHALLQGIFLTQGSNLGLLHCRQTLYHLNHQGCPFTYILFTPWCPSWRHLRRVLMNVYKIARKKNHVHSINHLWCFSKGIWSGFWRIGVHCGKIAFSQSVSLSVNTCSLLPTEVVFGEGVLWRSSLEGSSSSRLLCLVASPLLAPHLSTQPPLVHEGNRQEGQRSPSSRRK